MRFAFFGDIVGKSGRRALETHLPGLRERLDLDFVVANGENAAAGFGITEKICEQLFDLGVDVITLGNHAWDQREALTYIDREPRLIRPANYPKGAAPGKGSNLFEDKAGRRILVVNVMGNLFMEQLGDAFAAVEDELAAAPLGEIADAVIIDIHGEATSEKTGMGVFCDGRASLVVGTHTHVPTADTRILPGGTGFQTDAGMCGAYDSVIGMDKEEPLRRFTTRMRTSRMEPATGEGTLCGVFVETDDATGLAKRCEPIRLGGELADYEPAA